ncbi:hypothetical protein TTHERM_00105220 (macronuclear) [Tetrahymena thermophila SB210]|uniref:Uncharacterized protein n=1 Tax=Tetrahymena thermophila (strain SB210) TaxID=312017 RepID=Q234H6_TETTS|nr:hypothetical protein TTHERM_00105220 [Tetrahymena thermophila SB210]EAR92027.1 hypothetical protein TTHERM_00105220 [Tetrahymena thermophila SB210]|eukprot:XP_001012272.1 hypothetical protein TTHERM_00105220 [Tetrahymena thermophila SB210]
MDRIKVLNCQIPSHEEQNIVAVCMKKECQYPSRLMCVSCLISDHCEHGKFGIKVNEFSNSKNLNDVILNWKGENELFSKMIYGLLNFQKQLDVSKIIQELDNFEREIMEEVKNFRKQILNSVYAKKEQGDEEQITVLNQLSDFLQIKNIQKLFNPEISVSSCEGQLIQDLSNDEINKKLSDIVKEQNDNNSLSYQNCMNLLFNSQCIYSYSFNLEKLYEEQSKIQLKIKNISKKIQKYVQNYCFQASQAYCSETTVKVSGENNRRVTFTNNQSYSVAYLNCPFKIDQKPIEMTFQFDNGFNNKHFCIGLRKENLKDENSYNKTPYKCLHCQIGDGILEDNGIHNFNSNRNSLIIQFLPSQKQLYIYSERSECKLSIPFEDKNDLFRLYFWRGGNNVNISVKLVSITQI